MSTDLRSVNFRNKSFGDGKWPETMDELVDAWIAHRTASDASQKNKADELFWAVEASTDLCHDYPDLALEFILSALERDLTEPKLAFLAAGPMEDLLVYHGPLIIDRIETLARQNPKFRYLLGGVWQNAILDTLWQRVLRAAPTRW